VISSRAPRPRCAGRARGLALFAAALGGLALWTYLATRPAPAELPALPLAAAEPATLDAIQDLGYVRSPVLAPPPAPAEGVATARSFLAEYYGDAWAEKEALMEAAGARLDVPFVFHPWEEAAAMIAEGYEMSAEERGALVEQKLAWPAELTLDWVRQEFDTGRPYPLAEEDLPLLRDLVADQNLALLGKAELWVESIQVSLLERFQRGQYFRMPYTNQGLDDRRGFYAKGVAGLGWATGIALTREDYPEIVALEGEIMDLRDQRRERVVRFLHGRIAR